MAADYTQEKLWQAVQHLIGPGSIQRRLEAAAGYIIRLQGGDAAFDEPDLQRQVDMLIQELTKTPARGDEGTIAATTRMLTDQDGAKIAEEIFELFCRATDRATVPVGFEPRPT